MGKVIVGEAKMSYWCYGLVREKNRIRVCEIYWKKNKPSGYTYVFRENETLLHWWWVIRDLHLIAYDLFLQLKNHHIINEEEFK